MDDKIFCFPCKTYESKFFKEQDKYIKLLNEKIDDKTIEKLKESETSSILLELEDGMIFILYYCR